MTTIQELAQYALQIEELQAEIAEIEAALKDKKEALRQLTNDIVPNALNEADVSEVKLSNGDKLTTKDMINATFISDAKIAKAKGVEQMELSQKQADQIEWLEKTGNADLIKNEIKVAFKAGENTIAKELRQKLIDEGHKTTMGKDVHSQTLKAFMKRRLEEGEEIPFDQFNVSVFKMAKIERAK